jgi:agmatine deiminase
LRSGSHAIAAIDEESGPIMRQPPEWAPHEAVWIGFPSHPALWLENLDPARAEVLAFARAVAADGRGEQVMLIAADVEAADAASAMVAGSEIAVLAQPFGDIWLRDTAPIIGAAGGRRHGAGFLFNGWGGKYELPGDDEIGARLAGACGIPLTRHDWVLEGGAIDIDGTGLLVTTEQCLLNPNRNPQLDRHGIAGLLAESLEVERILWLGEGLAGDHTDGHVDNLARFVAPNRLAIPRADAADDPNAAVYDDARARARAFGLDTVDIPSPGLVERDGEIVPASYMNFYIGNAVVVVPQYGQPNDAAAVDAIGALFPGRVAIGLSSDHILTGGGSFHCISQQIPRI